MRATSSLVSPRLRLSRLLASPALREDHSPETLCPTLAPIPEIPWGLTLKMPFLVYLSHGIHQYELVCGCENGTEMGHACIGAFDCQAHNCATLAGVVLTEGFGA